MIINRTQYGIERRRNMTALITLLLHFVLHKREEQRGHKFNFKRVTVVILSISISLSFGPSRANPADPAGAANELLVWRDYPITFYCYNNHF